jgi:hypothetical protein
MRPSPDVAPGRRRYTRICPAYSVDDLVVADLHATTDPDRFCSCGRERSVDAVRRIDRKTGDTLGYVWTVACPELRLTFHADGSARWTPHQGHTKDIDCFEPSWLPRTMRGAIRNDADDYGHCSDHRTIAAWEAAHA